MEREVDIIIVWKLEPSETLSNGEMEFLESLLPSLLRSVLEQTESDD